MTFLGVILAEKSKKHTQKIQKNFLDRVLEKFRLYFELHSQTHMDFEIKNAQNTVKKIFLDFFECFSAKITSRKVILKKIFYSTILWIPPFKPRPKLKPKPKPKKIPGPLRL
jgi:hypothetical protein